MDSSFLFHSLSILFILLQVAVNDSLGHKVFNVSVVGSVFCDQCSEQTVTKNSAFLRGASIVIVCKTKNGVAENSSHIVALTNERGCFKVRLPETAYDPNGHITCSSQLLSSSDSQCASFGLWKKTPSDFILQPKQDAVNLVYSVGIFSFLPQKAPPFCSEAIIPRDIPILPPLSKLPSIPKLPPLKEPLSGKLPPILRDPFFKLPKLHHPSDKEPEVKPHTYRSPAQPQPQVKPKVAPEASPKIQPELPPKDQSKLPPKDQPPFAKLPHELSFPKFPPLPKRKDPFLRVPHKFKFPPKWKHPPLTQDATILKWNPPFTFPPLPIPKLNVPKITFPKIPFPKLKIPLPPQKSP